jgi:hypothetical protein
VAEGKRQEAEGKWQRASGRGFTKAGVLQPDRNNLNHRNHQTIQQSQPSNHLTIKPFNHHSYQTISTEKERFHHNDCSLNF